MTELRIIEGGNEKEMAFTEITAHFVGGGTLTGYDGPWPSGERSLQDETLRFAARVNGGGWFSVANGVIFNTQRITAIDVDIVPSGQTMERQDA